MKGPQVSITVTDLTLRFPVYGVDAKSLKKSLAVVTVGGRLGSSLTGATEVTALSGAYEPDEGQIEIHGQIASLLDLNLGIDPSATGLDNIRLRGRIAGRHCPFEFSGQEGRAIGCFQKAGRERRLGHQRGHTGRV